MKKIFFISFLVFIFQSSFSQNEIPVQSTWILTDNYGRKYDSKITKERYRTNSNGNIEGLYIAYDKDGKTINTKINYKNGVKNGQALECEGSCYGSYLNDNRVGEWVFTSFDGSVKVETYINGKIEGKSVEYSDKTRSRILSSTEYKNGIKNGKYILYTENGEIKEKGNYVNDLKDGEWLEYLYDVVAKEYVVVKGNYVNGERDKLWINFGILYSYLSALGIQKSYEPSTGSYGSSKYGGNVEFVGGGDETLGPKKGYNSEFNLGKLIKEHKVLTKEDSLVLEKELKEQEELKLAEKKRAEEEAVLKAEKEAKRKKTEDTPLSTSEILLVGSWNYKIEDIENTYDVLVEFSDDKRSLIVTLNYEKWGTKQEYILGSWVDVRSYKKDNQQIKFRGIWVKPNENIINLIYDTYDCVNGTLNESRCKDLATTFSEWQNSITIDKMSAKKMEIKIGKNIIKVKKL